MSLSCFTNNTFTGNIDCDWSNVSRQINFTDTKRWKLTFVFLFLYFLYNMSTLCHFRMLPQIPNLLSNKQPDLTEPDQGKYHMM